MIEADRFVKAFGSGGTVDQVANLGASLGFAMLTVSTMPGREKAPACPLSVPAAKRADTAAQRAATEAGHRRPQKVRHDCGVHHATLDPPTAVKAVRAIRKREHAEPNLGIEVGRSRMILVDCDTAEEVAGWRALWAERTVDPRRLESPPTVATPGKVNDDGVAVHYDGGHWWFTIPDSVELPDQPGSLVLPGAGCVYWRNRLALVPPSARAEGPYRLTGVAETVPTFLLEMILAAGQRRDQRRAALDARIAAGDLSDLDRWAASVPWSDLLEPDGWGDTGQLDRSCGCPTWTRPGEDVSSTRSAIAHEPGCSRFDCDLGHGPLYLWTDHPPEFLASLVAAGRRTITKVQYVAARDHEGDVAALVRDRGLGECDGELDEALDALGKKPAPEAIKPAGKRARFRVRRMSEVEATRTRYLWDGRVPTAGLTLFPGAEGIGKSTVIVWMASGTTRGTMPGDLHGQARDVVVIAMEDSPEAVVRPRLDVAGADVGRVYEYAARFGADDSEHELVIPRDLPLLARDFAERGLDVGIVWIDSLVTVFPDDAKTVAYKDSAKVLKSLNKFGEEIGAAVVAPWHLNKAPGSDTAVRMMDSRAFRTGPRSVVMVVADPEAPGEVLLALDKSNAGRTDLPAVRFRIISKRHTTFEIDPTTGGRRRAHSEVGVAELVREEQGDGRVMIGRIMGGAVRREQDPKHWLRDLLLERGETLRSDVMQAGADAGYSSDQVKRAARTLGVVSVDRTVHREGTTPLRLVAWHLDDDLADELDAAVGARSEHGRLHPPERTDRADRGSGETHIATTTTTEIDGRSGRSRRRGVTDRAPTDAPTVDQRNTAVAGAEKGDQRGDHGGTPSRRRDGAPRDGDAGPRVPVQGADDAGGRGAGSAAPVPPAGPGPGVAVDPHAQPGDELGAAVDLVSAKVADSPGITERGLTSALQRSGRDVTLVPHSLVVATSSGRIEARAAGTRTVRYYPAASR